MGSLQACLVQFSKGHTEIPASPDFGENSDAANIKGSESPSGLHFTNTKYTRV